MSVEQPGLEPSITPAAAAFHIRPADEADIPTIRAIAEAAWPIAFGTLISEEFLNHELNREYSDAALTAQMQEQGHRFLLAEHVDGVAVLGFVSYGFQPDDEAPETLVAMVHKLYLRPDLKGKGIGAALLGAAVAAAAEAGCAWVELSVNRQNPAIQFYERQGFSIASERDIEVGPGFVRHDYRMVKRLAR